MKILFLCKRYYTNKDLLYDHFGRLFHLPVELSRNGATVSVIALDYRNGSPKFERVEGVTFQTVPATIAHLPRLPLDLVASVQRFQPDIIIASGDSHIGFAGKWLAARAMARFVFDVYDYYPAFAGNRFPGMRAMFYFAVKQADLTLCASTPLVKRLITINRNTKLIENGVNRRLFRPMNVHASRDSVGLPWDIPVVGYFGAITPKRGPLLFEAVRHLRDRFPRMVVLLAGTISACRLADSFIFYKGQVPQESVPVLISACNAVTIPYDSDPQIDMQGPCKVAEYLACERPVVATRVSGHELDFRDAPESLCDPSADDMARVIDRQLTSPKIAAFPAHLDWSDIAMRLQKELKSLQI